MGEPENKNLGQTGDARLNDDEYIRQKADIEAKARQEGMTAGSMQYLYSREKLKSMMSALKQKYFSDDDNPIYESLKKYDKKDVDDVGPIQDFKDHKLAALKHNIGVLSEYLEGYSTGTRDDFARNKYKGMVKKERSYSALAHQAFDAINSCINDLMVYEVSDAPEFTQMISDVYELDAQFTGMQNGSLMYNTNAFEYSKPVHHIFADKPNLGKELGKGLVGEVEDLKKDPSNANVGLKWAHMEGELFDHDPCPEDVIQGDVGDCYLVASLSAIAAQDPDRIREMIVHNPNQNTVTVRFYNDKNEPVYVTVDDSTLCYDYDHKEPGKKETTHITKDTFAKGANWVKFIEKAYAASGLHVTYNKDGYAADPSAESEKIEAGYAKGNYQQIHGGASHAFMAHVLGIHPDKDKTYNQALKAEKINLEDEKDDILSEAKKNDRQEKKIETAGYIAQYEEKIKHFEEKIKENDKKIKTSEEKIKNLKAKGKTAVKTEKNLKGFTKNRAGYDDLIKKYKGLIEINRKILADNTVKPNVPACFPDTYTKKELDLYNKVKAVYDSGRPVSAGTVSVPAESDTSYEKFNGLPPNHAYAVTGFSKDDNGNLFINVKNPHNRGGRKYTADGRPYYDSSPAMKGESRVELRDFIKSFDVIYSASYDKLPAERESFLNGSKIRDLYKDAFADVCTTLDKSSSFFADLRSSKQFNDLRKKSDILKFAMSKKDIKDTDIKKVIESFFQSAEDYKKYRDENPKGLSGESRERSANRYMAAEMICSIKKAYLEKQGHELGSAVPVDMDEVRKDAFTLREDDSTAKTIAVQSIKEREKKAMEAAQAAAKKRKTAAEAEAVTESKQSNAETNKNKEGMEMPGKNNRLVNSSEKEQELYNELIAYEKSQEDGLPHLMSEELTQKFNECYNNANDISDTELKAYVNNLREAASNLSNVENLPAGKIAVLGSKEFYNQLKQGHLYEKSRCLDPFYRKGLELATTTISLPDKQRQNAENAGKWLNEDVFANTLAPVTNEDLIAVYNSKEAEKAKGKKAANTEPGNQPKGIDQKIIDEVHRTLDEHMLQQLTIAKTLFLNHLGDLHVVQEDGRNTEYTGSVADTLAHGGRTMFMLPKVNGDSGATTQKNFFNARYRSNEYDKNGERKLINKGTAVKSRRFATHSAKGGPDDAGAGAYKEGGSITMRNNYQMNPAIGGFGKKYGDQVIMNDGKNGQVFIQMDTGSGTKGGYIMIGFENEASQKVGRTGHKHSSKGTPAKFSTFMAGKGGPGAAKGGRIVDLSAYNPHELNVMLEKFNETYTILQHMADPTKTKSKGHSEARAKEAAEKLQNINELLCGKVMSYERMKEFMTRDLGIGSGTRQKCLVPDDHGDKVVHEFFIEDSIEKAKGPARDRTNDGFAKMNKRAEAALEKKRQNLGITKVPELKEGEKKYELSKGMQNILGTLQKAKGAKYDLFRSKLESDKMKKIKIQLSDLTEVYYRNGLSEKSAQCALKELYKSTADYALDPSKNKTNGRMKAVKGVQAFAKEELLKMGIKPADLEAIDNDVKANMSSPKKAKKAPKLQSVKTSAKKQNEPEIKNSQPAIGM